jgi:hypothetical protein
MRSKKQQNAVANESYAFSELRDAKAQTMVPFIDYSVRKFIFQKLCLRSLHDSFLVSISLFFFYLSRPRSPLPQVTLHLL